MQKRLLLLAGGACGTAGRYLLSGAVYRLWGAHFPYGTLVVNLLGCLAIGFLGSLSEQKILFLMVGLLGVFTTFSTFMYDSWKLMQNGELLLACVNLTGSLLLGLMALWVGHMIASFL